MKIKTSELTGAALDWAVCKATGLIDAYPTIAKNFASLHKNIFPSTDWSQGGPIIEREEIELGLSSPDVGGWFSCMNNDIHSPEMLYYAAGPTPLIAAMRCYVASKLGDEVDVPEELI